MKRFNVLTILVLIACFSPTMLSAQTTPELNAIQTVVPFLTIAPDSRAGSMGDAGVATVPDNYSIFWNAAKLAFIDGNSGFALSYSPWLRTLIPDINIAYVSFYKRIDARQVMAMSLIYSSLGDIPFTDDFGNIERTFKPNEFSFDGAYSRIFAENFSGGVAFRFIYSNLTGGSVVGGTETKPGISFAADLSAYYNNDTDLSGKKFDYAFGLNFSNIGSKMSYTDSREPDFIPMNMRLGTSGAIHLDRYNKVTLALDFNKLLVPTPPKYNEDREIIAGKDPNVAVPVAIFQSFVDAPGGFREELREITYSLGAEYLYNEQFALRGGYFHENASKGNRKYFTAGAGFRMNVFAIDVSYLMPVVQNHPLARTLRFSLAFEFDALRNASRKSS
ncbi:MAG: type IX secretion system outer membrane channel protein PorV [Bacteroidales bacterium]